MTDERKCRANGEFVEFPATALGNMRAERICNIRSVDEIGDRRNVYVTLRSHNDLSIGDRVHATYDDFSAAMREAQANMRDHRP